jgi:hypothetical protein
VRTSLNEIGEHESEEDKVELNGEVELSEEGESESK